MRTILLVLSFVLLGIALFGCATQPEYPQIKECAKACKKSNMERFEDDNVSCSCSKR